MRETSASKPLLTHRKPIRRRQNRRRAILPGSAWKVSYLLSMLRPVWRRRDSRKNERPRDWTDAGPAKLSSSTRSDRIYLRVALLALAGALVGTPWALCEGWQGAQ